jgi:hypothetical protein
MSTKSEWKNGILTFYDGETHERVGPQAPLVFCDDFIYPSLVIPDSAALESGVRWCKKITAAAGAPTVVLVANSANGLVECALHATNEKEDAGLYHGDNRSFSLEQGCIFECRAKLSVLPAYVAEIVFGLVGAWADGPDAILYSVFFTADGSGLIYCEMDDNATDRSVTSGVTVLATEWHTYRIDATDIADVKFFIDGVGVALGTTFAYAATGANAILQPYLGCYKAAAAAALGNIQVDFVRIYQKRS